MHLKVSAHYKTCLLALCCAALDLALAGAVRAADDVAAGMILVNDNAAWSWFEDERAIIDPINNKLLVSSVANASGSGGAGRNGDIDMATLNLANQQVDRFVLHPALQADDHNSAAIIIRPDGRYLAMYGTHASGGEVGQQSRYRISANPGDSSSWNAAINFDNNDSMTYSNLHYLPNDNGGAGRMYNFVRTIGFDPNILVSNNQGSTWTYGGRLLAEGGGSDRPYTRYFTSGDRIHVITTERHPRDFDNSVFSGYIQNGQLFDSGGTVIDSNLFDGTAVAPSALTPLFATGTQFGGETMRRAWTVDVAADPVGNPVAVFQARAGGSDLDHRFFYGRWDGAQWQVNQLAFAGSYLYAAENDYTGLVSIDPNDTNTVYLSSEVHPATKAQLIGADGLRHYELFKGKTTDNGATWNWTPITFNSTMHNVRPLVPKWDGTNKAVVWLRGDYTTYTNYDMDAVALINPELSDPQLALSVDFGASGQTVQPGFQPFTREANPAGDSQSESYDSPFASTGTQVTVTLGGGDIQFADRGDDVAGPIGDIGDDFALLNDNMTLSFGNLAEGNYQLVLYAHDRDINQLTYDIRLRGADLGTLNPVTGANPNIGLASARVAFGTDGSGDVTFTLDGVGLGASVVLNGLELYQVGDFTGHAPPIDLNADGKLDFLDYQQYLSGLHVNLTDLTAAQAYALGDLNGDFQNDFFDFQLFRQSYDEWNGQGAFAEAFNIPEPTAMALFVVGMTCGPWWRTLPGMCLRATVAERAAVTSNATLVP
jgi:hypothetical protein